MQNQSLNLASHPCPSMRLQENTEFKLFIIRLRDHITQSRNHVTDFRFHILYENSKHLLTQLDQYRRSPNGIHSFLTLPNQPPLQSTVPPISTAAPPTNNSNQPTTTSTTTPLTTTTTTTPSTTITNSTPTTTATTTTTTTATTPPQPLTYVDVVKSIEAQGERRQCHLHEKLPDILITLQSLTTDFQNLLLLFSSTPPTLSSTTTSSSTTQQLVMNEKLATLQQKNLELLRTHVITPTNRPFLQQLFEIRQPPSHRDNLQELHSYYIMSALEMTIPGIDKEQLSLSSLSEPIIPKLTQRELNNIIIPDDVFDSLIEQSEKSLTTTLDQFNKCIHLIMNELQINMKQMNEKDLQLIYSNTILRLCLQEYGDIHFFEQQEQLFEQQINMMATGQIFRGD